ncbi:hypothetical protein WMY93_032815, partial [Mugilogobius chulae]
LTSDHRKRTTRGNGPTEELVCGEGLDLTNALLVKDVPPEAEVSFIEETLQTIKGLGRVKVRGRMYDPQSQSLTVLCECREKVNAAAIPLDVVPEGSAVAWRIFGPSEQEEAQGQAAGDGQNVPQPDSSLQSPLQASTPEAIIRAVGDILQMTSKPTNNDNNLYRRLRTFSGVTPTPPGEEQLENWVEQARLMIEECDRSEREKKMRIMESVKGPALEILQAVRFNNPDATSSDYIDIFETTFGTPESGEELYFAFRMLCQHPNERLSEFLRRLERVLTKVVKKGGLQSSAADKARLDQVIKGAVRSDLMILNLGLRDRRDSPPTFLELLNEIRLEEEHEASRRRLHPPKTIYAKAATVTPDTETTELKDLKAEIHQLRAQSSPSTVLLLSHVKKRLSQDPCSKGPETQVTSSVIVLALVCPDPRCSETIPVLIGTNVSGIQPFKSSAKKEDARMSTPVKVQVQENKHLPGPAVSPTKDKDLPVAEVKWSGPGPLVIPPGSEQVVICKVKENQDIGDSILITERAHSPSLPPSVLVQPTVLFSKMLDPNKFLVLLRNESLKQTAIPMGTVIAHLHVADIVTDSPSSNAKTTPAMDPSLFDFGDSPISKEWKERLGQKLAKHANVFSTEEWDVGLAKGVEHHIRLSDNTPLERGRDALPR